MVKNLTSKIRFENHIMTFLTLAVIHCIQKSTFPFKKVQLISKCLFGVFNSSKKLDLANIIPQVECRIVFVLFLEELKIPKIHRGFSPYATFGTWKKTA